MPPDDTIDLLRVLGHLWTWRRFILASAVVAGLAAVAITFLLPDRYRARATVLSSHRSGQLDRGAAEFVKDYLPVELFEKSKPIEIFNTSLSILESRRAMEAVVREFDLARVYNVRDGSMERATETLRRHTNIELTRKDYIAVTVYDTDPVRAAGMANAFVRILNDVTRDANSSQARNTRFFLEQRFLQADSAMRAIESQLGAYQLRHGMYALPEQTLVAINEAAQLQADASAADIEIGILERAFGAGAPQVATKRVEQEALNAQRRRLKFGPGLADSAVASILYPFGATPVVGMGYVRLSRDFRIQAGILAQLSRLLEKARLDEQRSALSVVILDRAVPPEQQDSPKRALIGVAFALTALFLSSAVSLRIESRTPRFAALGARLRRLYRIP